MWNDQLIRTRTTVLKYSTRSAVALAIGLSSPLYAAPADEAGAWKVTRSVSPLTDAQAVSAQLDSTETLANMIGRPEKASLVLRCRDGVVAVYVIWPEVLSHDSSSALLNRPESLVLKRIDGGKITAEYWDISEDGAAAGAFASPGALKLLSSIEPAKKLVVRMSGVTTQDASFDLLGIEPVATEIRTTCGAVRPKAPDAAFGAPLKVPVTTNAQVLLDKARLVLEADGYEIDHVDQPAEAITTRPKATKLTTKDADCGSYVGLPYLIDKRATTTVVARVKVEGSSVIIDTKIAGQYDMTPPRYLVCTSRGTVERTLAGKLGAP
jgi:hypothetical protein